jgi:hypothetical protein
LVRMSVTMVQKAAIPALSKGSKLFTPLEIGSLKLEHRVIQV